MSVLIKGVDMPKSCAECRFKGHGGINEFIEWCDLTGKRLGYYDNRKAKWQTERKPFCPLIEVDETAVLEGWNKVYPDDGKPRNTYCSRDLCYTMDVNGKECKDCPAKMDEVSE